MIGSDPAETGDQRAAAWVNMLIRGTSPHEVHRRLMDEREQLGSWWQVGESVAPVLVEIGVQWERGQITVLQEHLASERLARGLARCAESIAPRLDAPRALLVAAEGDEHTLGLSLVELVLREAGWISRWSGRNTPRSAVQTFVESNEVKLIALSASRYSASENQLMEQANWYSTLCRSHGVAILYGGSGAWPDAPDYGYRVKSLRELAELVGQLNSTRH